MKKWIISSLVFLLTGCSLLPDYLEIVSITQIDVPIDYELVSTLYCDHADINYLVRYDGKLYARSYALLDYAGGGEPVGVIDRLIDEDYIPLLDGETNQEEILGAEVHDPSDRSIILFYDHVYRLYDRIDE